MAFNFAMTPAPSTATQSAALQNLAQPNLVKQLYAGKPATQAPPVIAASGTVKNQNAPVSTPTPISPQPTFAGGTNAQGQGIGSIIPPSTPTPTVPTAQPITGDTTTPSGAVVNATTGQTISAPAPTPYASAVGGLLNTASGNPAIGQSAANIALDYGKQIASVGQQGANAQAGYKTTGTTPVGVGNAGIVAQNVAAQQQALATGESAALEGTAQQLTAQQQEAAAQQAAGTLAEPSNAYIQLPFNQQLIGADGQPIGGAGATGALQSAVVNAINLIKSGSGYSNAVAAANLGQFGPQGTTALLNALGPSFNVNSSDADAAAVAQNINTSATAQTTANANAVNSLTGTVADLSAARDSVANISNNLISQIAASNNLNPSNINAVNGVIQTIAGQTSNPQYQTLLNQMTDVVNTYAQILTPGANTDASKATAQGLLNSLAQGSTVQQVISGLDTQAQAKISGSQTALNDIKSGTNPNPATQLTGQSVQGPDGNTYIITN